MDPSHAKHVAATAAVAALDQDSPKYVSVVTLAEISFGRRLFEQETGKAAPSLAAIVEAAKRHALLDVTRHTAEEYADIKSTLARKYLLRVFRRDRPRWLENWVDKATGQTLQVDENDLWICAQARERDLVLVTADLKIDRIAKADPSLRIRPI